MNTAPDRDRPTMPSEVSTELGFFDRLASGVARFASRPWFFSLCLLLIIVWAPSIVWFPLNTWQLIINTATTIVTFLLVALLQNTQTRADAAVQHKLNAIAHALAELIEQDDEVHAHRAAAELRQSVGLEQRESA